MMTNVSTPRDWKIEDLSTTTLLGEKSFNIGIITDKGRVALLGKEQRANAELIVRAVNSYDALVSLVQELALCVERGGDIQLGPQGKNYGIEERIVKALELAKGLTTK